VAGQVCPPQFAHGEPSRKRASGLRLPLGVKSWHRRAFVVETIVAEVERVTFENEGTGFRVIKLGKLAGEAKGRKVTAVGVMPAVGPGTLVRLSGTFEHHSTHGERFRVESLLPLVPTSQSGMEKYLASGVLPGVGPATAARIVKYFGVDTLRVLDFEASRLLEVPGLGEKKVREIREAWATQRALSNLLLALGAHGVTPALAGRIVQVFGPQAMEVVTERPYELVRKVRGIGFRTADGIALSRGIPKAHPERVAAGALHLLSVREDSGHTASEVSQFLGELAQLLEVDVAACRAATDGLALEGSVVLDGDFVIEASLNDAERAIASGMCRLLRAEVRTIADVEVTLHRCEQEFQVTLAPAQKRAVRAAMAHNCTIVTGGPGVGKTTVVRTILTVFQAAGLEVRLAAPTGRAAKRLAEATQGRATTVHRLLEVDGRTGLFQRGAENPLEADVIILDECSMMDVRLMDALVSAIPTGARLVLVGDADQLPSVGPGAVLADLLASQLVSQVRLDVIFRQGAESGIIENSHRILAGQPPVGASTPEGDFFVLKARDPAHARDLALELVTTRIPGRFGFESRREIQVLSPMHKGDAGTLALNLALQEKLNSSPIRIPGAGQELRLFDKVLQTRNDAERDVFNGDLGEIIALDPDAERLIVSFDDAEGTRNVTYEKEQIRELRLAYATSIHKSQGSEYPAVVVILLKSHFTLLSRNLLYTAVTRAKKLCVLVTDDRALRIALGETRKEMRLTRLPARFAEAWQADSATT
jgi:exodeoxyribonuclease V alpha subunit